MPAVTPQPVAAASTTSSALLSTEGNADASAITRLLQEWVRPDLYATNPCRTLGLFPGLDAAVLVSRVEELLGEAPAPGWAFAPSLPLTAEQLRRSGQAADSAHARLVVELFWFWPTAYPGEGEDPALVALQAGDVETAYGQWLAAEEQGLGLVAGHNMGVMFHHAALERELERGPLDEEARAWWAAAVDRWTAAMAEHAFWQRWLDRCAAVVGPGDGALMMATARQELPRLLGGLILACALERGRRGEVAEARWLRDLAAKMFSSTEDFDAAVRQVLDTELERTAAATAATEEKLMSADGPCLAEVCDLLRRLDARRQVVEALAGADSISLRCLGARAIDAGLAGLLEHVRRTEDAAAVLPWVLYLAGWPAGPDQRKRVVAAVADTWEQVVKAWFERITGPETRPEAVLQICSEVLIPAVEQFSWDARVQAAYRQRVFQRLRELAREAWRESGDFEVSAQACVLAAELCDEDTSTLVVREKRQLWQQFQRAQSGALSIEFAGSRLEIDSQRIKFDGREWPVAALNGIRYGVNDGNGLGGEGPQVAWYAGRDAVVLDAITWFDSVDGGAERYRQIVEALESCVAPTLAARIVERVKTGQSVVFGHSALRPEGFVFQRRPGQLEPDSVVPYSQLTQRVESGQLVIGRGDDPAVEASYALATVWNAVAMAESLAQLADQV